MSPPLHVLLAVILIALRFATGAAAQEGPSGTSYLTPFPESDTYKLQAYGDAFAEGLIEGLNEAFAGDRRIQVARKHRPLAGIARADFDSEMKAEEASREPLHIAVIMIGYGDRFPSARTRASVSCWARRNGARNTGAASTASSRS